MEQATELQVFDLAEKTAKVKILTGQVAENIIEIRRTLLEVKENLSYVEFQDFQPVGKLGMRKLLALSGIEADDREKISSSILGIYIEF